MIFLARQRDQQTADDSTPPAGSRPDRTVWRLTMDGVAAWSLPIACIVAVRVRDRGKWHTTPFRSPTARRAYARRGGWPAKRACPDARVLRRRDQSRGPSLLARCSARRSQLLRPRRTPADLRSPSPSAYTAVFADEAGQTGLPCSVIRPCARASLRTRRDPPHPILEWDWRTWPSP